MAFIVFSLPRSRSAWLSHFLSYDGLVIGHDIGCEGGTPAQFMARIGDGTCETGAAFAWRLIHRLDPSIRLAVVRRDPAQVKQSLGRFGIHGLDEELGARDGHLAEIAEQPGVMTVQYEELATFEGCRDLFEFCLGRALPREWWERFDPINIQVDMPKQLAKLHCNRDAIAMLKSAAHEALADV